MLYNHEEILVNMDNFEISLWTVRNSIFNHQ